MTRSVLKQKKTARALRAVLRGTEASRYGVVCGSKSVSM